ncbi:MAG: hypothetical protein ACFBSE_17810 [Prochloraceae cyanobacterium]
MSTFNEFQTSFDLSESQLAEDLAAIKIDRASDDNYDRSFSILIRYYLEHKYRPTTDNLEKIRQAARIYDLDADGLAAELSSIEIDSDLSEYSDSQCQKILDRLDSKYHPLTIVFQENATNFDLNLETLNADVTQILSTLDVYPYQPNPDNPELLNFDLDTKLLIIDELSRRYHPLLKLFTKSVQSYNLSIETLQQFLPPGKSTPSELTADEIALITNRIDRTYHPLMNVFSQKVDKYDLSLTALNETLSLLNCDLNANSISPEIEQLVNTTLDRQFDPLLQKFPQLVVKYDLTTDKLKDALTQVAPNLDLAAADNWSLEDLTVALERFFHPFGAIATKYNIPIPQIEADLATLSFESRSEAVSFLERKYNPLWFSNQSIDEYAQHSSQQHSQNLHSVKQEIDRRQLIQFARAYDLYTGQYLKELKDSGTVTDLAQDTVDRVLGKFDLPEHVKRIQQNIQMLNPTSPSQNTLPPSDPSSNALPDQS